MKFDCCIFQFPCCFEAHDAKTNNPPKSTACKRLPITNTLTTLKHSPWKRSAQYHRVTVSGVISGAAAYQPPLPPCRVGNMLHSISGQFKVGCGRRGGRGDSSCERSSSYTGPRNQFKRASGFDLEYSSIIQLRVFLCFSLVPMFSTKANMIFCINHVSQVHVQ